MTTNGPSNNDVPILANVESVEILIVRNTFVFARSLHIVRMNMTRKGPNEESRARGPALGQA